MSSLGHGRPTEIVADPPHLAWMVEWLICQWSKFWNDQGYQISQCNQNQPRQSAMQRHYGGVYAVVATNRLQSARQASLDKDGRLAEAHSICQSQASNMGWQICKVNSITCLCHQGHCKVAKWSYSNQMRRCLHYIRILVGPTVVAARCKSKANAAVSMTRIGTKNHGKSSIKTTDKTAAGTGRDYYGRRE